MQKQSLITHLKSEGFPKKITNAFAKVKRELFIPEKYKHLAYENRAITIGTGQSVSQPYTIAFMLDLLDLENNQKILEVGSGSGYVLALINEISKNSNIHGIEIIKELTISSKKILNKNKNIKITQADGNKGLKQNSPFDRILVSASAREIPQKLLEQLKIKGVMVCVVGNSIVKIKKEKNQIRKIEYLGFSFVPLVGE
jgi:protein-L-isoaspartate(D-aspartate) O-methyltransferase